MLTWLVELCQHLGYLLEVLKRLKQPCIKLEPILLKNVFGVLIKVSRKLHDVNLLELAFGCTTVHR